METQSAGSNAKVTSKWISECLEQSLGANETEFTAIVTDSRKVQPGCLFLALAGDQFDGHDFLVQAIESGAKGLIAQKQRLAELPKKLTQNILSFGVDNTLEAYRILAKSWRMQFQFPIVMIAGSNGKTTTKELLSAALLGRWQRVHKTQGSQNGFVGIPLTLLELRSDHEAAVIEVGIDEPGAMIKHIDTVAPTQSLLTIIGPEHLEKLVDIQTVAREENLALTVVAAQGGKVLINCDDPYIAPLDQSILPSRKLSYTLNVKDPDPSRLHGKISEDGRTLEVSGAHLSVAETFCLPLPGRHNALNCLAAIAASFTLGLTADEIRKGLGLFKGADGRSQVVRLANGAQVVCDYYNSQPASLRAGLELLAQLSQKSGSWACLADMLELGALEENFHREPAKWITELGIENIVLYGKRMKWLEEELKAKDFKGYLKHFETHAECAAVLNEKIEPRSTLLIKGSRGMKMEEVWKLLKK